MVAADHSNLGTWAVAMIPVQSLLNPVHRNDGTDSGFGVGFGVGFCPVQRFLWAIKKKKTTTHGITESLRLEKTSKIIESNHQPITTMPTSLRQS